MNIKDARAMLGVSRDCSLTELNKRYRILALKLHPDKNGNTPEATAAFQEVNAAYRLLLLEVDKTDANDADANDADANDAADACKDSESYSNIFMNFIKSLFLSKHKSENDKNGTNDERMNPLLAELLHRIVNDYASVSVGLLLDSLDPVALFQLYETLEQYNAAIKMDARIFEEITRIIREKMQKNNIIILKPSLKDVIQNNISVVQFEGQTFYVPLWHSELHYRIEDEGDDAVKQLIVRCIPELPEHMSIDANNELHIDVRADIKELLNKGSKGSKGSGALRIPLYDSEFVEVQVRELHVVPRQTIVLRNNKHGISLICSTNIYDVANKAPICVHVHLV
jgi:curved DNA-binding protein CbpA